MNWFKKHIHILLLLSCFVGYTWLYLNYTFFQHSNDFHTACLFKNVTSLPCPSCGITRAILVLLNGDFLGSISINPLGFVMFLILSLTPIIVITDWIKKGNLVTKIYNQTNILMSHKKIAFPFFTLIIMNWIWNIFKHL